MVRASAFQAEGREFDSRLPLSDSKLWVRRQSAAVCSERKAHVAQVVEHVLGKDEVTGSNPVVGSSN